MHVPGMDHLCNQTWGTFLTAKQVASVPVDLTKIGYPFYGGSVELTKTFSIDVKDVDKVTLMLRFNAALAVVRALTALRRLRLSRGTVNWTLRGTLSLVLMRLR
jgi:hypothetical protein